MKPDSGKARDKQRLDDKKAKKAAAKEARKQAVESGGVDVTDLVARLKTLRGANRRAAFDEFCAHDAAAAVAAVRALAKDAVGKNLAELGVLLLRRANSVGRVDGVVGDVLAGRYGDDVSIVEHAPALVGDACGLLQQNLKTLAPDVVVRRCASLGVWPMPPRDKRPPRAQIAALLSDLVDDVRFDAAEFADFKAGVFMALVELAASLAWAQRERVSIGEAAVAAFAVGGVVDDEHVAAFVAALKTLPAPQRLARYALAQLPQRALSMPIEHRVPLLRALYVDDAVARDVHHGLAVELRRCGTAEALAVVLLRPDVNVDTTVTIVAEHDVVEAWSVVEPLWATSRELRDRWLATPHAGCAAALDATLPLVAVDPMGAMAVLVRNDDPRAALEIVQIVEAAATTPEGQALLLGLLTSVLAPGWRARALNVELLLPHTDGGPRPDVFVAALRAYRPLAVDLSAVDAAIERLSR